MNAAVPQIDPEISVLIPALTPEEREGLRASIAAEGCRDPLVVWTDTGILLDGHNRLAICTDLGKPYNTVGMTFADRNAAKAWVIFNQLSRRNLNNYQRTELGDRLKEILMPAAEARMLAGVANPVQISGEGRIDDQIAKAAGVSHDTIHKARYVRERAAPAVIEALRAGSTTINHEYQRMRNPTLINSSASNEWFTPSNVIEAARRVLGDIDLDPASCTKADETVRAAKFYDEEANGLEHEWRGRVWLNPPYGGLAGAFTEKLITEYRAGRTTAAIFLVNADTTETKWFRPLFDYPLCFARGRIAFLNGELQKTGNTHGSLFAYFGPDEDRFVAEFKQFGPVVKRIDK